MPCDRNILEISPGKSLMSYLRHFVISAFWSSSPVIPRLLTSCLSPLIGHFERRISFGYDADLVQVRAEFDGEMLRISIPRRLPPVNLWNTPRPGPIGRSG